MSLSTFGYNSVHIYLVSRMIHAVSGLVLGIKNQWTAIWRLLVFKEQNTLLRALWACTRVTKSPRVEGIDSKHYHSQSESHTPVSLSNKLLNNSLQLLGLWGIYYRTYDTPLVDHWAFKHQRLRDLTQATNIASTAFPFDVRVNDGDKTRVLSFQRKTYLFSPWPTPTTYCFHSFTMALLISHRIKRHKTARVYEPLL